MRNSSSLFVAVLATGLIHCNVSTTISEGTPVQAQPPITSNPTIAAASCGTAFTVVLSDYQSSNVAVVGFDGKLLSESLISSASTAPGISAPLSGDVALPIGPSTSGEIVLLDRFPNATLTWVDPKTAKVRTQLSVGTGFASNPHDYLTVDGDKSYITRYESNTKAGAQAFDHGSDILVIDSKKPAITAAIAIPEADSALLSRPDRMLKVGDRVIVTLQRISADYATTGEGKIAIIDARNDTLIETVDLPGLKNCGPMVLAADKKTVAVACSGTLSFAAPDFEKQIRESAIVLLDATASKVQEIQRFAAKDLGVPIATSLAFASDRLLMASAYGDSLGKSGARERVVTLNIHSGEWSTIYMSPEPSGDVNDVRCASQCGGLCIATAAKTSQLIAYEHKDGALVEKMRINASTAAPLPPRYLSSY